MRYLFVEEGRPLHGHCGVLPSARLRLVEELLPTPLPIHLLTDASLVLSAVAHDSHFGHLRVTRRLSQARTRLMDKPLTPAQCAGGTRGGAHLDPINA